MPAFTRILAGLALGTALTGGSFALAAAAGATTVPLADGNEHINDNRWNNENNNWWNNQNFWNQGLWKDSVNDHSGFGIVAKGVALGFQDKTNRDNAWFNNSWWANNQFFNNRDNNDRNFNHVNRAPVNERPTTLVVPEVVRDTVVKERPVREKERHEKNDDWGY
ncbi:hypothetical protein F5972_09310 [Microbispora cellulosiformans]|uniref:Uncharacterized protein n=1 Tax=Microbispora cellulosiformans TaxID=2614688 RepID=A0A5J5K809_9ACTN|nr:hypothetical protein [Microbispora cellulosiformans]KAA9379824.1 hypothetical protein F5972_09310 [Microbispora cellulosiformans]